MSAKVGIMDNANTPLQGQDFHRRFSRFKVSAPVIIERGEDAPCLGMTANAAVGGCCLLVSDAIWWSLGDRLKLTFEDDQTVHATIKWHSMTFIAVEFDQPLDKLVLDSSATPMNITAAEMRPVDA
jgi:hypothetical protein